MSALSGYISEYLAINSTVQAWLSLSSANTIMLTRFDDTLVRLGDFEGDLLEAVIELTHHTMEGQSEKNLNI